MMFAEFFDATAIAATLSPASFRRAAAFAAADAA